MTEEESLVNDVDMETPPAFLHGIGDGAGDEMPSNVPDKGNEKKHTAVSNVTPPETTQPIGADYKKVMSRLEKMFRSNKQGVPSIFLDEQGNPMMLPATRLENAPARAFLLNRLNDENINVMIDPSIRCRVSLRLKDVTLWTAVERVLDTCGLGWKINGRIFQVDTLDKINATKNKRSMVIRPYYLKYLRAEEVKQFILGESTVKTTDITVGQNGSSSRMDNEDEIKAEDTEGLLTAGTEFETPSVVADESTNCVIIKDEPENVERIARLLDAMDIPRPQIRIQTWIVETNRKTATELGMRWSAMVKVGDTEFFSASRDLLDGSQSQFRYPLEGISRGVLPPQANKDGSYEHDVNNQPYQGRPYSIGIAASGSSGAIVAEMQALEQDGDLRILSRPELMLQDNREATITQGQDIYQRSVTADRIGTTEINAKLEVTVKPHITPGGSLVIDVRLKDRWPNLELSTDRDVVVNEKGIETRLFMANGQTVVLGGIRHARQNRSSDGVPLLKDIPYLGYAFKYQSDVDELEELLLIMRPEIVKSRVMH
jgi:type IV pilus assembly protein PilQ